LLHAGGATLPRLVIHGDFGRDAVILDGDRSPGGSGVSPERPSSVDGLTSFSKARFDLRVLDLAAVLRTFARVPGGFDLDRCADLVGAYAEVDRLSPGEVEALPGIFRAERLVRIFRLTSRLTEDAPDGVVHELVKVVNNEAAHLRWLEEHEAALIEALGSALVA
jgi:Ser/Thr protein kinase RdoA (MazF antagonist)